MFFHRYTARLAPALARSMVALPWVILLGCASSGGRGTIGESCQSHGDCVASLVCVRQVCSPGGLGLSATGKQCYRVECSADADCCADFVPDANCDTYDADCQADPSLCLPYFSLCVCNVACQDQLCVDQGPGCVIDAHCGSASKPFCVSGACVECVQHADCPLATDRCVDNTCQTGCVDDSECPLFYACVDGACTYSGCTSDRECVFFFADSRGVCVDGGCSLTCSSDWECDVSNQEICSNGVCMFAGCSTDAECRVVLDLQNEPAGVTAVCQ